MGAGLARHNASGLEQALSSNAARLLDLRTPDREGGNAGRGSQVVEILIIVIGRGVQAPWQFPSDHHLEIPPLDPGQVPHQAEQGEIGRRHRVQALPGPSCHPATGRTVIKWAVFS